MIAGRLLGSVSEATAEAISMSPGSKGVVSPFEAIGRSGVRHSFTLGRQTEAGVDLVCDVVISDGPVDETKVLSLFIRAYDVGVKQAVLCVSPSLASDAKKLADTYRIRVVEGGTESDATAKLVSLMAMGSG